MSCIYAVPLIGAALLMVASLAWYAGRLRRQRDAWARIVQNLWEGE